MNLSKLVSTVTVTVNMNTINSYLLQPPAAPTKVTGSVLGLHSLTKCWHVSLHPVPHHSDQSPESKKQLQQIKHFSLARSDVPTLVSTETQVSSGMTLCRMVISN